MIFPKMNTWGSALDSGHHNIAEHNSFALLREFKGRVFATHIHDNNSEKDMHVLPYSEECNVDWKKFMENIEASYFEGSLMLEACYPIDYEKMTGENDELLLTPDSAHAGVAEKRKGSLRQNICRIRKR